MKPCDGDESLEFIPGGAVDDDDPGDGSFIRTRVMAINALASQMEEVERLKKLLEQGENILRIRHAEFCRDFASAATSPEEQKELCDEEVAKRTQWRKSAFWWATDGLFNSLNELPTDFLEDILSYVGAFAQSRMRAVSKLWNALIMRPRMRKNLLLRLEDAPFNATIPFSRRFYGTRPGGWFPWYLSRNILTALITPDTDVVMVCNGRRPDASHWERPDGLPKRIIFEEPYNKMDFILGEVYSCHSADPKNHAMLRLSDLIRPNLVTTGPKELTFTDFTSELYGIGACDLDPVANVTYTFLRCSVVHLLRRCYPSSIEVPVTCPPSNFVILPAKREFEQLMKDVIGWYLFRPPDVLPADMPEILEFLGDLSDKRRRKAVARCLRGWEENYKTLQLNAGVDDLAAVEWNSLCYVTLCDLRLIRERHLNYDGLNADGYDSAESDTDTSDDSFSSSSTDSDSFSSSSTGSDSDSEPPASEEDDSEDD
ncbi:hypothetical protein BV898_14630 [Hypsibius exemplaris]|uniref:F-box domain-containing protein n=1 Tax=Hypsibius exemplaris TaxID=2072580 RepID=A0A9X6RJN5_HYPEX|nr:hypothetical protein BV898_14630 [Hypsibius exemplaris]